MSLTSEQKLKEKFIFLKEGEAFTSSKKINSKNRILFHKGEACVLLLSTNLRRNSDFRRRMRHLPNPNKKIQNIEFCLIRVRHVPHL